MAHEEIILNIVLAFLGVIVALWYENLGSPRLIIQKGKTTDDIKQNNWRTRFLHLNVTNKPWKLPFVPRQSAVAVHGTITFLDSNRNPITNAMPIRWDGAPEPIKYEVANNQVLTLPDPRLVRISRFIDIFPDEHESLAIAIKILGDNDAFGWTSDSYFQNWRHQDYQIGQGEYIAKINLKSGDSVFDTEFVFTNTSTFTDFDLI